MRLAAVAFLIGVLALQSLSELPHSGWLIPGGLALALLARHRGLRIGAICLAGFLWAWLMAMLSLADALSPAWEGKDLIVEGVVASIPDRRGTRTRFEFDVERMRYQATAIRSPGRVRLSWYQDAPRMRAGESWRLTVRLKRPWGFMNPGGFDYEAWLFRQGIRATGYVRSESEFKKVDSQAPRYGLLRWRQGLADALEWPLAERSRKGVLQALAIGERNGIEPEEWALMTRTGINHLVAISGLHIGLVATAVFFLVRWLWVLPAVVVCAVPAVKPAAVAALLAAAVYAGLAGFAVPTVRALLMVGVVLGAIFLQRATPPSRSLALALLLVLIFDPMAVLAPGFWLSFGAVSVILLGMTGRLATATRWWRWGRVQWVVFVGLTPLLLYLFKQAPLVAPLANLVAVPVVSLLVVPCVLTALLVLAWWPAAAGALLWVADWALSWLWRYLEFLAGLPYAQWSLPSAPAWAFLFAALGAVLLLAPRGWPGRWLAFVFWLPLIALRPAVPARGDLTITVLDVGQGLASVVRTSDHVLVFDAGPRYSATFNAGEAVVLPFLRDAGVRALDMLVLSNADSDHSGGAPYLLGAMPVSRVISGAPAERLGEFVAKPCETGQRWQWDGVDFEILHPDPNLGFTGNNQSCVLRIHSDAGSILLPGDIERGAERHLEGVYRGGLHADLMVAPHHGSATSSSAGFIQQVQPRFVVFPVGYRNRFSFPRQEILARYRSLDAEPLQTSQEGAVTFRFTRGEGIVGPIRYRREARRYWHSR